MASIRFVCLACSRKKGRLCIAGLRTDGGGWLRPVGDPPEDGLRQTDCRLDDGALPSLGDVIEVDVVGSKATCYQPENQQFTGPWRLVGRLSLTDLAAVVLPNLTPGPDLLGNRADSIAADVLEHSPALASLALIEPVSPNWSVTTTLSGYRQGRVQFRLSGFVYNLAVTDRRFERQMLAPRPGALSSAALGIGPGQRLVFAISLGGPFDATKRCYKLVAGVIVLPS